MLKSLAILDHMGINEWQNNVLMPFNALGSEIWPKFIGALQLLSMEVLSIELVKRLTHRFLLRKQSSSETLKHTNDSHSP